MGCRILSFALSFMIFCSLADRVAWSADSLSREMASAAILAWFQQGSITKTIEVGESDKPNTIYIQYRPDQNNPDRHYGPGEYDRLHLNNKLGDLFVGADEKWMTLQQKGLISFKMTEKRVPNNGGTPASILSIDGSGKPNRFLGKSRCDHGFFCEYYDAFQIGFTPRAFPFVNCKQTYTAAENIPIRRTPAIYKCSADLILATAEKVEVTGITKPGDMMGRQICNADFTVYFNLTPFGEVYLGRAIAFRSSAVFVLYDDGWRLGEVSGTPQKFSRGPAYVPHPVEPGEYPPCGVDKGSIIGQEVFRLLEAKKDDEAIQKTTELADLEIYDIDLSNQQLKKKFPKAELHNNGDFSEKSVVPDGVRMSFRFPVVNGCRACPILGEALVGFDFSSNGSYLGARLLQITSVADKINEIRKLLEADRFSEADQKMTELQKNLPSLRDYLSSDSESRGIFAECRRLLTIKYGRVKDIISNKTFALNGTVINKRIVGKSEAFNSEGFIELLFEFEKGIKLDCVCRYDEDIPYLLIDDAVVGDEEGWQKLKDVYPVARFFFSDDSQEWVDRVRNNIPNEGDGICPVAIAMYSSPQTVKTAGNPQLNAAETCRFDAPVGTISMQSNADFYSDPELKQNIRNTQISDPIDVTGFVRTKDFYIVALQVQGKGTGHPLFLKLEDSTNFKQANEDGTYLNIVLGSSVFNKNGKVGPKETMKTIDAFIAAHPQAQFASHAMLDYLLCLEWLYLNDKTANKDAIVRLAEMYVEKAQQRFPDAPQTKRCESLLLRMKTPSSETVRQ
jgi:hypothetical protein